MSAQGFRTCPSYKVSLCEALRLAEVGVDPFKTISRGRRSLVSASSKHVESLCEPQRMRLAWWCCRGPEVKKTDRIRRREGLGSTSYQQIASKRRYENILGPLGSRVVPESVSEAGKRRRLGQSRALRDTRLTSLASEC